MGRARGSKAVPVKQGKVVPPPRITRSKKSVKVRLSTLDTINSENNSANNSRSQGMADQSNDATNSEHLTDTNVFFSRT